ncbi:MAG: hypothetical protein WBA55_14335 [Allopontixanthobacter sediminis]
MPFDLQLSVKPTSLQAEPQISRHQENTDEEVSVAEVVQIVGHEQLTLLDRSKCCARMNLKRRVQGDICLGNAFATASDLHCNMTKNWMPREDSNLN